MHALEEIPQTAACDARLVQQLDGGEVGVVLGLEQNLADDPLPEFPLAYTRRLLRAMATEPKYRATTQYSSQELFVFDYGDIGGIGDFFNGYTGPIDIGMPDLSNMPKGLDQLPPGLEGIDLSQLKLPKK